MPPEVPPAFRRKQPSRCYIGLTDDQVLRVAASALRLVEMLPAGSPARQKQWDSFNAAMGELASRATVHALERMQAIREREQAGERPAGLEG